MGMPCTEIETGTQQRCIGNRNPVIAVEINTGCWQEVLPYDAADVSVHIFAILDLVTR